jgi:hypothetical protein
MSKYSKYPEITIDWNGDPTSEMSITVVWPRAVSRITATIPFNPTPENEPNSRKADDPV